MKEKIKKKKKKKLRKLLLALVVLVAAVLIILPYTMETVPSSLALSQHTKNPPKLIAHRGLSGIFPQNTIPAFSGAEEYGFWGTECDIHSTKDGEWVIIHDEEISNLTDGEGYIKDMTFEEIQNIMVDSGNGIEEFGKLPLPTFEEFLSICEKGDLVPIIELKSADTKLFPELKKIIDSFDLSDDVAVISFNREYLTEYRKIDKDITLHLLVHTPTKDDVEFCTNNDIDCLNFNHTCLYKAIPAVLQAKKNGLELAAFTVDNTAFSDVMAIFGADYITTNKIIP